MNGVMLIYKPEVRDAEIQPLHEPPELDVLNKILDGPIEYISGFNSIAYGRELKECIAYVNETGKIREPRLKLNAAATLAWEDALNRNGKTLQGTSALLDHLVGNVIVLFGDKEFMQAL